jgi:FKBP-type peptidyl-prolyl cis-trans isomerase SlyD
MQIGKNSVVTINYTLTDSAGKVLDSNQGNDPLPYLHGYNNIIPGLEKVLTGKSAGENFKVTISPEEGYGTIDPKLVQKVSKSAFQGVPNLSVGMQFQAQTGRDGQTTVVRVTEVSGEEVTVDANHLLAGVELHFDVTIVGVRAATPDELAHGHVHGPSGHHHH